jgi:hypothetical protein
MGRVPRPGGGPQGLREDPLADRHGRRDRGRDSVPCVRRRGLHHRRRASRGRRHHGRVTAGPGVPPPRRRYAANPESRGPRSRDTSERVQHVLPAVLGFGVGLVWVVWLMALYTRRSSRLSARQARSGWLAVSPAGTPGCATDLLCASTRRRLLRRGHYQKRSPPMGGGRGVGRVEPGLAIAHPAHHLGDLGRGRVVPARPPRRHLDQPRLS